MFLYVLTWFHYFHPSGILDSDEITQIVKDLYGRRGFKTNASAQKCIQQLKSMEWYAGGSSSSGGGGSGGGDGIDFQCFLIFSKNHPTLLYPAFQMQYDLQSKCLGSGFWQCAAAQRRKLEKIIGCSDDNDLLGVLQAMHQEEDAYNALVQNKKESRPAGSRSVDEFDSISPPQSPTHGLEENQRMTVGSSSSSSSSSTANKKKNNFNKYRVASLQKMQVRGKKSRAPTAPRHPSLNHHSSEEMGKKKKEKKEKLKGLYKKEMRASRIATSKGKNVDQVEHAKKKAGDKYKLQQVEEKKRKDRQSRTSVGKSGGLLQKDASLAWQCRRCKNANYAVKKCVTCGGSRGHVLKAGTATTPRKGPLLSPKRKVVRS